MRKATAKSAESEDCNSSINKDIAGVHEEILRKPIHATQDPRRYMRVSSSPVSFPGHPEEANLIRTKRRGYPSMLHDKVR